MQAGAVNVKFLADISDLQAKMRLAENTVGAVTDKISKSFKGLLGVLAAGISVAGLTSFVRSAIDAADETSKLSQKTSVAVKDIAGLQLAFRQAGAGEVFATSMAKMSKSVADGSKAFETMGIATKNNDGTLKSTRVLIGEVADKFAGYEAGIEKTALAVEIFGKSGADLIPLLNAGAQGLADYDAMAQKLGLTLSEETARSAEKFNDTLDLVGQGAQGMARQIAAQLLPTLNGLAGSFFETFTSGDKLRKTADFLATSMKLLFVTGVGIVEIFSTIGKTLGAAGAQVVALLSGDFDLASKIGKEWAQDVGAGWKESLNQIESAWNSTGSASVEAMAQTMSASKRVAPLLADLEKKSKAAAEAEKARAKAAEESIKAAAKAAQENAATINRERDAIAAYELSVTEAYAAAVKGSQDSLKAAQAEFDQFGLSKSQIAEITLLTLESTQAKLRDGSEGFIALQKQIDAQKELIGVLRNIETRDANIQAAKDAAAAWEKTADQINQTLTDAIFRSFESGKGFFKTFWNSIVNTFKTSVLRLLIQPVTSGIGGLLAGASGAANAGGLGGIGSLLGGASNLSSLATAVTTGFAGSIGSLTTAILGQTAGNAALAASVTGSASSAAAAAAAAAQAGGAAAASSAATTSIAAQFGVIAGPLAGALAGIGLGSTLAGDKKVLGLNGTATSAVGSVIGGVFGSAGGPVGTAIGAALGGVLGGAVNALFGRGPLKIKDTGITGTLSAGGNDLQAFANFQAKGGLLRKNKNVKEISDLNAELQAAIDAVTGDVGDAARRAAAAIGLDAAAVDTFTKGISLTFAKGLTSEEQKNLITAELEKFGPALVDALFGPALAGFARTGETSVQTLERLGASLQAVNGTLSTLGAGLLDVSVIGADAASKLIDSTGGPGAFAAQSASFFDNFFSEEEKRAAAFESINSALSAAGLSVDASQLSREEFKQLAQSQDLMTESGRTAFASILSVNDAFSALVPAADEVSQAWQSATDSIFDEVARIRGLSGSGGAANAQAQFAIATAQARAGDLEAARQLPALSRAVLEAAALTATTATELRRVQGQTAASLAQTGSALGTQFGLSIPSFDVGTPFVPQDTLAFVHRGEAIIPAAQNTGGGTDALVSEVRALREEVAALRRTAADTAENTRTTAKTLVRVTRGGDAMQTEVAA